MADSYTFVADITDAAVETSGCLMWLKDPLNPANNMMLEILANNGVLESASTEAQLVLSPSGRPDQVVLADVVQDEAFNQLVLFLADDDEWIAFERLRAQQSTLLLQLPYGDLVGEQHYIRLGELRSVDRFVTDDMSTAQKRRVTIAAREVVAP